MQKRIPTYLSLLVLILMLPLVLQAQWENRRVSKEYYDLLKESLQADGLMVVLKTNNSKIEALEKAIKKGSSSTEQLKKLLAKTRAETEQQQRLQMQKMQEHYQATPVYFVFDTSLKVIGEGQIQDVVVGSDLQINAALQLPSADLPYIISGTGDNEYTNGGEGLLVVYKKGEALIKYDSFGYFFNHLLARDIAEARRLDKALQRLQEGVLTLLGEESKRDFRWVNDFYPS